MNQEDPLEEVMATHSSILAWRILWTEEPGRLSFLEILRTSSPCKWFHPVIVNPRLLSLWSNCLGGKKSTLKWFSCHTSYKVNHSSAKSFLLLSYLPLARDHRETPNRGITTLHADPWSGQKHALLQTSPLSCHPLVEQVCSLTHLHSAFLPSPYITSSPALSPRYCNYLQWWSKREMMSQVWTWFSKENPWPFSMYLCIWVM